MLKERKTYVVQVKPALESAKPDQVAPLRLTVLCLIVSCWRRHEVLLCLNVVSGSALVVRAKTRREPIDPQWLGPLISSRGSGLDCLQSRSIKLRQLKIIHAN